ncbi:conserved hypothetical protein [Ricinus communis]|uniref:Uncharacterized protein n=1 Tax=Ricinus communis TaxID=3988 RepID=B9TI68_RICCO|nr:conserved hypothetical protein [Ricinus communis]
MAFDAGAGIGRISHAAADTLDRIFRHGNRYRRMIGIGGIAVDVDHRIAVVRRTDDLPLQGQEALVVVRLARFERIDVVDNPGRITLRAADFQRPQRERRPAVVVDSQRSLMPVGIDARGRIRHLGRCIEMIAQLLQALALGLVPVFLAKRRSLHQRPLPDQAFDLGRRLERSRPLNMHIHLGDAAARPGIDADRYATFALAGIHLDAGLRGKVAFGRQQLGDLLLRGREHEVELVFVQIPARLVSG